MSHHLSDTPTLAWMLLALIGLTGALSSPAWTAEPDIHSAVALRAKHAALDERLRHNPFERELYLVSAESPKDIKGDIFAVVDYPFATVSGVFKQAENWCDVLNLHLNTKYCRAETNAGGTTLAVRIGKKYSQPVEDAYPLDLRYRVTAASAKFLEIQLSAQEGPLSTRNYRIQLQAIPLTEGRTFLHFSYAYGYGMAGRIAMKTYLALLGGNRVGFTKTLQADKAGYIGGMRGVVERNAMRYYLAIDAYLAALSEPPAQQEQTRLDGWFTATEQYSRQLHELGRDEYMSMKRIEFQRQRAVN